MLAFFVHGGNGGYAVALNRRQALFVAEYLKDLNASAAARRAGYSEKTAFRSGIENMQKPAITEAIAAAMKDRSERVQITADRVLLELSRLAFLDIRKAFNADGSLKGSTSLTTTPPRQSQGLRCQRLLAETGLLERSKRSNFPTSARRWSCAAGICRCSSIESQ
jgi:hypothetical protein